MKTCLLLLISIIVVATRPFSADFFVEVRGSKKHRRYPTRRIWMSALIFDFDIDDFRKKLKCATSMRNVLDMDFSVRALCKTARVAETIRPLSTHSRITKSDELETASIFTKIMVSATLAVLHNARTAKTYTKMVRLCKSARSAICRFFMRKTSQICVYEDTRI